MRTPRGNYVLEASQETERLDQQSRMSAFDFEDELQFLKVLKGQKILDAGCGSGIVSSFLSKCAPEVKVVGWDVSEDRIQAAIDKYGSEKNITFVQKNLLELGSHSFGDGRFDTVVCRYVLRHFSAADGKKVIQNLFSALLPGGTIYLVDVEGVLGDLYPASPYLRKALSRLREAKSVDFQVARKLPSLLVEQGFESVDWHVLVSEFKGDLLMQEIDNLKQAIKNAESFAKKTLGGAENFKRFQKEYFSALQEQPGKILYYNRVVAVGTKPISKLKRLV